MESLAGMRWKASLTSTREFISFNLLLLAARGLIKAYRVNEFDCQSQVGDKFMYSMAFAFTGSKIEMHEFF